MGERMKMQMAKKQKQESSKKNRWRLEKRERCWKAEKMNELRKYSSIGDWKAKRTKPEDGLVLAICIFD